MAIDNRKKCLLTFFKNYLKFSYKIDNFKDCTYIQYMYAIPVHFFLNFCFFDHLDPDTLYEYYKYPSFGKHTV